MPIKPSQRRKGEKLLQLGDPKPYKVHGISPLGKVTSLPEARFTTLEGAMRYVRPRRLVAIYNNRKKIWPTSNLILIK